MRSITFLAFAKAVSGSPSFLKIFPDFFCMASICFKCSSVLSKPPGTVSSFLPPLDETISFVVSIGTHLATTFFLALSTSQVVFPTTAINLLKALESNPPLTYPSL